MRKENNHRSEMVSQLLYGDCFKIIGTKKEWLQITTLVDCYTGWIDNKQSHAIEESFAKKVGVETPSYATQLIDCLLYTSPSPRDTDLSRMPSSA